MTHLVGPKGQVVIPKRFRDALGLQPGDEVEFQLADGAVLVEPARRTEHLKGSLRGLDLVGTLESDREAESR